MQTVDRLLFAALLLVGVLILIKREDPAQALPLVKADYPVCITIHPAPLGPQPTNKDPHPRMLDSA